MIIFIISAVFSFSFHLAVAVSLAVLICGIILVLNLRFNHVYASRGLVQYTKNEKLDHFIVSIFGIPFRLMDRWHDQIAWIFRNRRIRRWYRTTR